jgi:hypothetical protein
MRDTYRLTPFLLAILSPILLLAGCLESGEKTTANTNNVNPGGSANSAPVITGNPPRAVLYGNPYSFTPTATDADGDTLTFTVQNLPSWASFNSTSGELSGTPTLGNIGSYQDIVISVSDGALSNSLPAFSVDVTQAALGSITLQWDAPTQNTDGTALTDLAGYKMYYGLSTGNYPNEIVIDNPGTTTYVVDNLGPNTYYFVSTALNSQEVESTFSNVTSFVVSSN